MKIIMLLVMLFVTANAQILFKSDMDTESDSCWSVRPTVGCGEFFTINKLPITTLYNVNKNKMLKITYTKDENQGGVELKVNGGDHLFTKFHFMYNTGFDFGCGVKSHRIRSMNEARQVNNYDIIIYTQAAESDLCLVNNMGNLNIARNGGAWWGAVAYQFQREVWYSLETEIKLNTPGVSNGEARMWINDSLVFTRIDLNIRDTMTAPLNRVMFGGWYSNGCRSNPCPNPDTSTVSSYLLDFMSITKLRISGYDKEFFRPARMDTVPIFTPYPVTRLVHDTLVKVDTSFWRVIPGRVLP